MFIQIHIYTDFFLCNNWNCLSDVMIRESAVSAVDCVSCKTADYKLVFGVSLLNAEHYGVRAMTGWIEVCIKCLSGMTCLHVDFILVSWHYNVFQSN